MALDFTVISCSERYPKSINFSGWPERETAAAADVPGIGGRRGVAIVQRLAIAP